MGKLCFIIFLDRLIHQQIPADSEYFIVVARRSTIDNLCMGTGQTHTQEIIALL